MKITFENLRHKSPLFIGILIFYYFVGILLYFMEGTRSLFGTLTPLTLLITFGAVLVFQKDFSVKMGVAFVLVFIITFIIEIIGVNTGALFGRYEYGHALGPTILHTPILIGLNWLILIYCSAAIVNHHFNNKITRVMGGTLLMVAYDLILEYVAPIMNMWSWDAPYPGIRNFVMWFLVAMVLHFLFQRLGLNINNKPARYLFFIQIIFFSVIGISNLLNN